MVPDRQRKDCHSGRQITRFAVVICLICGSFVWNSATCQSNFGVQMMTFGETQATGIHKFEDMQSYFYRQAIAINLTLQNSRVPFELKASNWKRGTGGLDDADRRTLFDLYYKANSVFEWGLGESTEIAARVGVPRYAGIDSDATWVAQARNKANLNGMTHFRFSFADIGETMAWGKPKDETLPKIAYDYQVQPLAAETEPFDIYMVDGRYRVACFCVAWLHAMKYNADLQKVRVLIHDNDEAARNYGVVNSIADIEIQNKKLWVYKHKENVTEDDIFALWERSRDIKA